MKKIIWPILHPIRFTPYVKDCWGFTCQKNILIHHNPGKQNELQNDEHFKQGVERGYHEIFKAFYKKDNFLSHCYTTPKLSIALNTLQKHLHHRPPNLNFKLVNITVLNTITEYGLVKSNEKILGLWTPHCIQKEIMIGMIGPEYQSIWHQQPIRKVVHVLYEFPDRKDVWTWQCSANSEHYFWNVKNINQILL